MPFGSIGDSRDGFILCGGIILPENAADDRESYTCKGPYKAEHFDGFLRFP